MFSRGNLKRTVATVVAGVLIGGGVTMVSPAGAEVSQFAATNWNKIWKKKLQKKADQRYYTKALSDARYSTKTETSSLLGNYYTKAQADAALGGYYTKAQTYSKTESDAAYAPKAQTYTKAETYSRAESDAKYAPAQPLYRGTYMLFGNVPAAGYAGAEGISFGATFPSAPTPHYIKLGDPLPVGCSGSSAAPNAAAGHLCVFESYQSNAGANRSICRGGPVLCGATDPFGAAIYTYAAAAGQFELHGTWAARPSGPVTNPAFAPAKPGAVNEASGNQGSPTG